ncbi:MAG TPA: hypothetical protein VMH87_03355 [Pseudomonadales bacterium]|nr:hypothetical protein [Pseudomonadales bacterium]
MKALRITKKTIIAGLALAGLATAPSMRADVEVYLVGGSASQSVIYDRATNFFNGGTLTVTGGGSSAIARFVGTSTNASVKGFGTITLDINLNNGAIDGLSALISQVANSDDTNFTTGPTSPQVPTFVDSATSPEAVGFSSSGLTPLPTYVVPLVYIKNTNSIDTAAITNLTQRQAVSLETSTLRTTYYGGTSPNYVYFVGRNNESAVRTETDLNIYSSAQINTYFTNSLGQPVLDTSGDPGLSSAGVLANTVLVLTNSIGTVAVQNIKKGLGALAYEGVSYSATNVINGSYPLWGYENYYYVSSSHTGTPSSPQLAVINAFYQSVTNATFETTSPVFVGLFIPNSALQVQRFSDGGPISPLPGFFQ